jgi:hypothetical protein
MIGVDKRLYASIISVCFYRDFFFKAASVNASDLKQTETRRGGRSTSPVSIGSAVLDFEDKVMTSNTAFPFFTTQKLGRRTGFGIAIPNADSFRSLDLHL